MKTGYRYIVIDDEPKAIKLLNKVIARHYDDLHLAGAYTEWELALEALHKNEMDLVFADISMPHKNGISLLEMVPELDSEIIFVTAYEEYALKAFKFSPTGYVLKPIDDASLISVIDRALKRIQDKRAAGRPPVQQPLAHHKKIGIRNHNGLDYIDIDDILFLEASTRYTKIVTKNKFYLSTYNLGKFKSIIDSDHFFLVHRSYIVNINKITRYESAGTLIMENGDEIPVSKNIRDHFLQLFNRV